LDKDILFTFPKRKEKGMGESGKLVEQIMIENFPNIIKNTNVQIQESQHAPTQVI
jgi:hypothetical protein